MAALTAPDAIEKVATCLLESHSVWYSPNSGPWYDREGILLDAANLVRAAGGDEASGRPSGGPPLQVAAHLFKFLSPHLGEDTAALNLKTIADMKALLKSWGLTTGGNKGELLARIREQTEVAQVPVMTEGGATALVTPRHSKVSAATYAELNKPVRDAARISASKCREIFFLTGSARAELPSGCVVHSNSATMYLLSEAKAAALANPRHKGSWAGLSQNNKKSYYFIPELNAAEAVRKQEIQGVLVARGWRAGDAAEIVESEWGGVYTWGDKETLAIDAAADALELAWFCITGPANELFEHEFVPRSLDPAHCRVRASLSDYKKELARNEWAAHQAVAAWARQQASMEAITNNWRVPRSLLPVLQSAREAAA